MPVPFVDPRTHDVLARRDAALLNERLDRVVAPIVGGIPRFVEGPDYSENFGWQWKRWSDTLSDERNTGDVKRRVIMERTGFDRFDLDGKTLLECGMGGGDDTEVLLKLPVSELHAFDLSDSVERARDHLHDSRLVISQASILEMPYADESFDVVFCHRVIQHTPHPERALRAACRKVKVGGLLFAHSYKLGFHAAMQYKYKYRFITKRMRVETLARLLDRYGERLYGAQERLARWPRPLRVAARSFLPFDATAQYGDLGREQMIELSKLITFDALTPRYDKPMTSRRFRSIIESEGFEIVHFGELKTSPVYCTAVKRRGPGTE